MDNKINGWLEDILRSIDEITDFLPVRKDFHQYQADLKTKKAVERNIEIIAEAVNRITKSKKDNILIKNAQKIIGTRNRLAHEYDNISDELIWTIILKELPKLKAEVSELMDNQ